ncbi:MAG: 5'-nucleotidase C-terminal domain-containing protein [Anaerolineae bacterium]|nr:5'-nucleotidase C-terminal domain-containing protein [Anaerolineae bacterium]
MKKQLLLTLFLLLLLFGVRPALAQDQTTVTLLHFSDYHAHAVPFYGEGEADTAGIARLIAYLKPLANDPNVLVFSGGDTMNLGSPAWSDKYQCAEWSWLNGLVDAMAFGNHDADYGPDVFAQCRSQINYPILGANVLAADGQPLFQYDGKTYRVFDANGHKIGVFALAGPDFVRLIKPETMPAPGVTFADRVATAQQVVKALREQEQVAAVVLIGHALYEDDVALAQAVPGIDLILGTHSHRNQALMQIPNTNTYYISPFQYVTYLSQVDLTFSGSDLTAVNGQLVRLSNNLPEDPDVAQRVAQMQADLQADPQYAPLFQPVGEAAVELSTAGQFTGESVLGNLVMDIFRSAARSHLALSTSSSFREPIPPGTILEETLRTSMPYTNRILVFDMTGAQVQELLNYSVSRSGSDFFSQVSGVRFNIADGQANNLQILADPADPAAGYAPLDPAASYKVATTDFQGLIAGGYKDIFAPASYVDTGLDVRTEVRNYLQSHSPVTAQLDGRTTSGAAVPAELPTSGGVLADPAAIVLLGLAVLSLGLLLRRQAVYALPNTAARRAMRIYIPFFTWRK